MRSSRLLLFICLLTFAAVAYGQKVTNIKRGSADFNAIIQAVTPFANKNSAHPVRVRGDRVRRAGDWAFIASNLDFVDKKNQGDGMLIAVLKKGRKWTIREISIGSGGMDLLVADWSKKHKLPKGLATDPYEK